jgi:DNA-binding transcriptional ArsR family regulator
MQILKWMLERSATIDRVFHALADSTRCALLLQLSRGPASVSELARPLPISLAAVVQHVQVLESSGLIATRKRGRVRTCRLNPDALLEAERWLARRRALWEGRLDRLDALVQGQLSPVRVAPEVVTSEGVSRTRRKRAGKSPKPTQGEPS